MLFLLPRQIPPFILPASLLGVVSKLARNITLVDDQKVYRVLQTLAIPNT